MANTLGLDDDMDPVDVVRDVEQAFGIEITNQEAEDCRTIGDIFDIVKKRFAGTSGVRCASAMAFYRLRRVLRLPRHIAFSTELRTIDNARYLFRRIRKKSSLRTPAPAVSYLAIAYGLTSVVTVIGTAILLDHHVRAVWVATCASTAVLALFLTRFAPDRFPKDCATVGALAEKTAALNFGRLARSGARSTEKDIWAALVGVLTERSSLPASEIKPDTWCLESQLRQK